MPILLGVAVVFGVVVFGAGSLFVLAYGRLWLTAVTSQVPIGPWALIRMHFLKLSPTQIVNAMIQARQASLPLDGVNGITTKRLEAHALSNGNVPRVIAAIISAQKAKMDLDFDRAAAIDLAGLAQHFLDMGELRWFLG